jgi:hypothetical protein
VGLYDILNQLDCSHSRQCRASNFQATTYSSCMEVSELVGLYQTYPQGRLSGCQLNVSTNGSEKPRTARLMQASFFYLKALVNSDSKSPWTNLHNTTTTGPNRWYCIASLLVNLQSECIIYDALSINDCEALSRSLTLVSSIKMNIFHSGFSDSFSRGEILRTC